MRDQCGTGEILVSLVPSAKLLGLSVEVLLASLVVLAFLLLAVSRELLARLLSVAVRCQRRCLEWGSFSGHQCQ